MRGRIAYWTGVAHEGSGDTQKAAESWHRAVTPPEPAPRRRANQPGNAAAGGSAQTYYQGLAFQKLGQMDRAKTLFQELLESARNELKQPAPLAGRETSQRVRTANAHYLAGLGYLGLKDRAQAKTELSQAVQMSPDLLGARTALASLP
ncbi:MAG: tetratricopeptide repeat protein [Bryobacteraceae bacterium]|jgi:tetratricopeptide (TPR) repeat protein